MGHEGLTEKQIVELETKNMTQLALMFVRDGSKAAETLSGLLRSYRVAASVANVAWKWLKETEVGDASPGTFLLLRKALHRYAPAYFHPYRSDVAYATWTLEKLYDYLSEKNHTSVEALMEDLFQQVETLRKTEVLEG